MPTHSGRAGARWVKSSPTAVPAPGQPAELMPFTVIPGELAERTQTEGLRQACPSDVCGADFLPMLLGLRAGASRAVVTTPRSSRPVDLLEISTTNLSAYALRAKPFKGAVCPPAHWSEAFAGATPLGAVKGRSGCGPPMFALRTESMDQGCAWLEVFKVLPERDLLDPERS